MLYGLVYVPIELMLLLQVLVSTVVRGLLFPNSVIHLMSTEQQVYND